MNSESAADLVRRTREALAEAGFVRAERDGLVWWENANVGRASARPEGEEGRAEATEGRAEATEGRAEARPTFVLLHGANDHAGTWFAVAPSLAQRYRVIIPDLAGQGESEPTTGPIPMSRIVGTLEELLEDEREITMAGNSFGGWIALLYTLRNRGRVVRLFLESSGGLRRPLAVPLVARSRDEAMIILRAVHGPRFEPQPWVIDALLQRAADSPMLRLTELAEHDVEPRLGEIDVPTMLIWGVHDGVVPLDYGEALRDAIPGARLTVIEGAAHIPHIQQPQRFLQCLTAIS